MSRKPRPIVPAPPRDAGYPRATTVWRAFAAGVLTVAAFPGTGGADCALPEHKGDPEATRHGKKNNSNNDVSAITQTPKAMPGRIAAPAMPGEPLPVQVPTGGVGPPVIEGKTRTPEPVKPPEPKGKKAPDDKKRRKQHLDGEQASVEGPLMHIHPHGPDEPCFVPDDTRGRLVIKFG